MIAGSTTVAGALTNPPTGQNPPGGGPGPGPGGGGGGTRAAPGTVIVVLSRVTAPFWASALPFSVALVSS